MTSALDDLRAQARQIAAQRAAVRSQGAQLAAGADAQAAAAVQAAVLADNAGYDRAVVAAADLHQQRRQTLTQVDVLNSQLAGLVAGLLTDPCDLEPDVPLVLLPVRLETRYSADGSTLRVRIFPDDLHVDRLDRGLSDAERVAGTQYWNTIWDGSQTEDAAWQTLLTAAHASRAEWVAAALSPDLSLRPQPPSPAVPPVLPEPPPLTQLPPVARCLPDRFVVVVVQQGGARSQAVGNPVPPELVVGLPPAADPAQLVQPDGRVTLGPGMQWMIDPVEAQRVGMLVEVPLTAPSTPVEQVFALGVRSSLDPADSAQELAQLLDAHRYAEGSAFVGAGTPTNNTESDRADWTSTAVPTPPPTTVSAAPAAGCDAALAAGALGLDPVRLLGWPGADGQDQPLAGAANTALWQATWGSFIDRLSGEDSSTPPVGDAQREAWRDWWQGYVRGGGPLPLLRLGDQPYGLLPVSSVQGAWQPDGSADFEAPMLSVLRNARSLVAAGLANVAKVGTTDSLDQTLLDILGSSPHLLGVRVRSIGAEALINALQLMFGVDLGGTNQATQDQLNETVLVQLGVHSVGLRGSIGKTTRPLGLPLVLDDPSSGDAQFVKALLADQPRVVASVLQALLEICAGREQAAVAQAAPPDQVIRITDVGSSLLGNQAQQYVRLVTETQRGRVDPVRLHAAADQLDARFGASGPSELSSLQPIVAARTSLAEFALNTKLPSNLSQSRSVTALGAWLRAQARQTEFRNAAAQLAAAPLHDRLIAVAETLDCASHRYDAWITSLPTRRLTQTRSTTPTGVLLGAYGWVENLAPGVETTRAGGYLQAPSLTHAATAGVLRSGYLTHNPDTAGTGALAVDLSSARVRQALQLLDGVRQGQPLGALLGYLIERRLHADQLDVYTRSLRSLAPIAAGRLVDRADALPPQAQEAIGANNVVDGVALLKLPIEQIWTKLSSPPADNPYLDPSLWPALEPNKPAIQAILAEAADAYDAVSDVLLAESVHHLVQGNTARAAAAMSAAAGGDVPPVEPEVVRTPTRAVSLTHRVLVLLDDTAPGSGGWSADTPRALVEPRLAAWAENRLGPATGIVISVAPDGTRTTLDAAGVSALDLVFDSAGATVVDVQAPLGVDPAATDLILDAPAVTARLAAAFPGWGADPVPVLPDPSWPAGTRALGEVAVCARSLHALIAGAASITPSSFARPNDQPVRTLDPTAAAELSIRVQAAVAGLTTATTQLSDALAAAVPDPIVISATVDGLRPYGISLPAAGMSAAQASLAEATKRITAASSVFSPYTLTAAQQVATEVFGAGFQVLPAVLGANDLFSAVLGALTPPRSALRRWLRDLATVRPGLARYAETLLFGDAAGSSPGSGRTLALAQLAASGTAGTATWLGLPLPAGAASPDKPVTDVLLDAPQGYTGATSVAGLVVDEWTEQLPRRNADGAATVTTGLAVNANAPNARAPQAILLAMTPDQSRWSTDSLLSVLSETRELAGLRAVTLERQAIPSPVLPAIAEQSWSLQGETTLDLRFLATEVASVLNVIPYVKETGP